MTDKYDEYGVLIATWFKFLKNALDSLVRLSDEKVYYIFSGNREFCNFLFLIDGKLYERKEELKD